MYLDVLGIGHAVEEVEGLATDGLVRVFQALDHYELVLGRVARIDPHNHGQT